MHLVWNKTGEQGNSWIKGTVDIGGHANFRIVFEGVRGDGYQGDIAIDDISFTDCKPGYISISTFYFLTSDPTVSLRKFTTK